MSDEAVIREALETLTADERAWLATMPVWAGGVGGVAIATKYDRLVSRLEAAERERDEAVGNWDAWQDKCFAAEAALAEARAALVIAKSLAIHVSDFAYKEAPAEWDGGDLGYLVGGLASEANDVLDAIGRAALAAAGETAPSEPECICPHFSDLAEGTIIADLTCPVYGVEGTNPGDVVPEWGGAR